MIDREMDERLTERIIESIYGFYCMKTGKEYNKNDAHNEYLGSWRFDHDLSYPYLRNIAMTLKAEIYENMEFKTKLEK